MPGTLWLLPVALGDTPWQACLPAATRDTACRLAHFVVENAKTARAELKRVGHPLPLRELAIEQLPAAPTPAEIETLMAPLLAGLDLGLMSEAGCPAVADPGALLVRRAHELGIAVKPLVGPSSLLLALMGSGLEGQRFAFHGYLPAREPERSRRIVELEGESARNKQTQIFIETPYRNGALFQALLSACRPRTRLCLATDLSLDSESIATRRVADWKAAPAPNLDKRPTVFLLLADCCSCSTGTRQPKRPGCARNWRQGCCGRRPPSHPSFFMTPSARACSRRSRNCRSTTRPAPKRRFSTNTCPRFAVSWAPTFRWSTSVAAAAPRPASCSMPACFPRAMSRSIYRSISCAIRCRT
jgi:16S rRNA (cytidine1402-2'-O)-methyltransferase